MAIEAGATGTTWSLFAALAGAAIFTAFAILRLPRLSPNRSAAL
jgi:hypothetical protein